MNKRTAIQHYNIVRKNVKTDNNRSGKVKNDLNSMGILLDINILSENFKNC